MPRPTRNVPRARVRLVAAGLGASLTALAALPARPDPGLDDSPRAAATARANRSPEGRAAVDRALRFLAARQNPDGSFGRGFGLADVSVATTSLCGLAFLAEGNLPGRGPYGPQVHQAARYLIACQKQSELGYIAEPGYGGGSRMHGNGFAVLFLAELLGMSHDSKDGPAVEGLEEALRRAVQVIERYQTPEGGWNNEPSPIREEGSVTVTQCQALRAARNAGIKIGRRTVDGAVRFLRHCADEDGGIRYNLQTWRTTYALTGAGVASLCFLGEYDLPEVKRGIRYMTAVLEEEERRGWTSHRGSHRSFETFYATQALYQAGGPAWERWWPGLRVEILRRQESDGSWDDPYCPEMGTAFHTLALQVPNQILPIFQR
jgi:hypothetical protein